MDTVFIDGPSGAGKTTHAAALAAAGGATVVHMDDIYPGWSGLTAAKRAVARDVLAADRPGYRRYDWQASRPAEWVDLPVTPRLIVEGAGAAGAAAVALAEARGRATVVRVAGPADRRRARALARDPYFAEFWDMWAAQERHHFPARVDVTVHMDAAGLPAADGGLAALRDGRLVPVARPRLGEVRTGRFVGYPPAWRGETGLPECGWPGVPAKRAVSPGERAVAVAVYAPAGTGADAVLAALGREAKV